MNWVDGAVIGIVLISVLVSVLRGFVREVLSLLAWIVAFWVASAYAVPVSELLASYVTIESARVVLAFVGVLIVTLIAVGIINHLIGTLLDKTGLSGTDRLLGAVFGLARGAAIVLVLVLFGGLTKFPADPWWQEAQSLPPFETAALYVISVMPSDLARYFSY